MKKGKYIFTSESVGEGHPDKVCDQVSDAILDAVISQDPNSRVAIECAVKDNFILVCGEMTSKASINIEEITRKAIVKSGYDEDKFGFNGNTCEIDVRVSQQSSDIAQGVNEGEQKEQGAGDQGLMFGYATNETPEFMPLPIVLAHKLMILRNKIRKEELPYLRPDAKAQVSVEYQNSKPVRIDSVVFSSQHDEEIEFEKMKKEIIEKIIKPVCGSWLDENTKYYINPTGKFVIGGPVGDSGVTGRKIIVDTYGGHGSHGGGAFSGKDPSKVDRSAAYMARYIAKNIVAAELADRCEVQLAYAIGIADPVSILVDCFGTNKIEEEKIEELVRKNFPLKPAEIIKHLDLKKPIYQKTAIYGHFGRDDSDFTWEKTDKVDKLKDL
ncbi:methionine adenosyltransferase [Candidatus Pacearchaeota archaeon]|nr:methionine adenosyltransferase [Candidatus Pacearchaeota archaeon]